MTDLSPIKVTEPQESQLATRRSEVFRKLRVATTTIRTIVRMRNNVPKAIEDFDALYESVENSPTLPRNRNLQSSAIQAIDAHKATEKLFTHIKLGTIADQFEIERMIESSPSNYLRERSDSENIVNKANSQGVRPLSEAVRQGHFPLVKFLIDVGANPKLMSKVSKKESESVLTTAARWNYSHIVQWFFKEVPWTDKEVRLAYKATQSQFIKGFLKSSRPKAVARWKCCF